MKLHILAVGNSFAQDTFAWLPEVAQAMGCTDIRIARLYRGGCSINMHCDNLDGDAPCYTYAVHNGKGWQEQKGFLSRDALLDGPWDYILIQHGSADGSRYSKPESYVRLPELVQKIKGLAGDAPKIIFNLTWVGAGKKPKSEMPEYLDRPEDLYRDIMEMTQKMVLPVPGIDRITPTGTAIQNLRKFYPGCLTRDGYHLTRDLGRYAAAVAFYHALTGENINKLKWAPAGVTAHWRRQVIRCAKAAVSCPFSVSL